MLVETKSGCSPIISLATAGSSQAKNAVLLPITMVQPAEPSARLISSKISAVVAGSSSKPPRERGRLRRSAGVRRPSGDLSPADALGARGGHRRVQRCPARTSTSPCARSAHGAWHPPRSMSHPSSGPGAPIRSGSAANKSKPSRALAVHPVTACGVCRAQRLIPDHEMGSWMGGDPFRPIGSAHRPE